MLSRLSVPVRQLKDFSFLPCRLFTSKAKRYAMGKFCTGGVRSAVSHTIDNAKRFTHDHNPGSFTMAGILVASATECLPSRGSTLRILPVPDVSSPRPSLRILPAVEPSFTERIIARLNERESEERDPWLNDDYRQARLTVTYAGKAARSRSLKLRTRSTALTRNMSGNGSRHCGRLG